MKENKTKSTIVKTALYFFIGVAIIISPFLYTQLLSILDPITTFLTLAFPVALALISGLISGVQLDEKLKEELGKLEITLNTEKLPYYGTKFNVPKVPDKNSFWLSLLTESEREFIVMGRSNKHWIKQGGTPQLSNVGKNILRIIESGGKVTIVSKNEQQIIEDTKKFITENFFSQFDHKSELQKKRIKKQIKENFKYVVVEQLHYNVVLSDERIMVIPTLNANDFRDESIVLEIRKSYVSDAYANYVNDIYYTIQHPQKEYFPTEWQTILDIL